MRGCWRCAAGEIAEEKRRRVTEQLLYHLGRWIYLTDAADDLRSDMKTGSYNPLALRFAPEDGRLRPADRQALAQTMDGSVQAMAAAFELLPESGVYRLSSAPQCTRDCMPWVRRC